jgi:nucleoside phosphorylase
MSRIAIVAAIPGEVVPLVRGCRHELRNGVHLWRSRQGEDEWVAACAGAGEQAATRAFAEIERDGMVSAVVSVGWAGALGGEFKPGLAYWVAGVIDARTGERFETAGTGAKAPNDKGTFTARLKSCPDTFPVPADVDSDSLTERAEDLTRQSCPDTFPVPADVGSGSLMEKAGDLKRQSCPDTFSAAADVSSAPLMEKAGDLKRQSCPDTKRSAAGAEDSKPGSVMKPWLVTCARVADVEEKRRLAEAYGAGLVDMEAAAIARLAAMRGIPFGCIKGVSDGHADRLPDFNRFLSPEGQFRLARFIAFAMVRPWYWPGLMRMGENSSKASQAIRESLLEDLRRTGAH